MPARTLLVTAPSIKVNGADTPATDDAAIVELHVSATNGMPSQLTIRFTDNDFTLLDGPRYVVGAEIEVSFPDSTGSLVKVFSGEVVSVGVDQRADSYDGCELTVTALDMSHRFSKETKVRTFQKQKYSQVVSTIASEAGLRAQVEATSITFDYLIQTTTNYAFLEEIAFRTGYEWRIEDRTLVFKPRSTTAPITVTYGEDVRRIRARFTGASEATAVTVRSWDPLTKKVVVGKQPIATARSAGTSGGTSDLGDGGRTKSKAFAGALGTSTLIATSSDEAKQIADALGARVATADLDVRCECIGNPKVKVGATVRIENAGTKLSGTYYVTSVDHQFGRGGDMTTTFSTGGRDSSSIVDMLGGGGERVGAFGKLGLSIGIVTNNKDPDGVGRVRVKFPALSDQEESWWARVVTPGAGSNAGLMFMPQIDDEVLVGFEHGDLRRPFVLGGVWGAKAKPPTASTTFLANNKVVEWGVRTMNGTTLNIRSGDKPEDKHYKVALPDGTTLYMGSDKTELVAMNKSIELRSGQASILITDKGDIQIKGGNIKFEATQGITIDGLTIAAKAKTSFKAEGASMLDLKGGASASLEASGITQIKGSLVKIQ
jgi:phage protein D/phage baseplate assembly protein gpV